MGSSRAPTYAAVVLSVFVAACGGDGDDGVAAPSGGAGKAAGGSAGKAAGGGAGKASGGTAGTSGASGSSGGASGSSGGGTGGASGSSGGGTGGTSGGASGSSGGAGMAGGGAGGSACVAKAFVESLGKSRLLVGGSMTDATAASAPFDARYLYLAGGLGPGCSSCDDAGCDPGPWWGCWQSKSDPPGQYIKGFVSRAKADGQIPWITYYEILQSSQGAEGKAEVDAMAQLPLARRFFDDLRFLFQTIGGEPAIVHVEPDFWGYVIQKGPDPHAMPVPVPTANAADCASEEASVSGLGRCIVKMARKHAPNVKVALHFSPWVPKYDIVTNTMASVDPAAEAQKLVTYMAQVGALDGDLVAVDISDRDAGYDQSKGQDTWLDATNSKLPDYHQALAWSKALADASGKAVVWWQLPVGNASLPDQPKRWKDNKVDYFFAHASEFAAASVAGVLFGAGDGDQTTPETDGGNLVSKTQAFAKAPPPLCP